MPWDPAIPTAAQFISDSQPLIRDNYTELNTFIGIDHILPEIINRGKHNQTTLVEQAAAPETNQLQGALVTAQGPTNNATELYYIGENRTNDPNPIFNQLRPWTEFTAAVGNNEGFFRVAGGRLEIKYGFVPAGALTEVPVNFTTAFPNNVVPLILTQPLFPAFVPGFFQAITVINVTNAGFTASCRSGTTALVQQNIFAFNWLAIGRPV